MGKYLQHLENLVPDEEDLEESDAWTCVLHRGDFEAAELEEQATIVVDDPALLALRTPAAHVQRDSTNDVTNDVTNEVTNEVTKDRAHDGPYEHVPAPQASERGWGPSEAPEELKRTTFWARGADGKIVSLSADDAEVDGEEPPTLAIELPEPVVESSNETQRVRPRGARSSRITLIAALCGVAGSMLGVAIGLYVKSDSGASTGTLPAMVAVAPEPEAGPAHLAAGASNPAEPEVAPVSAPSAVEEAPTGASSEAASSEGASSEEAASEAIAEVPEAAPEVVAPEPATDPVEMTRQALAEGDLNRAASELERARTSEAPALTLAGLDARLAVMRGEGAPAVPRLRAHAQQHGDPALWVALGRVLVQAERDEEAAEAFEAATNLDPDEPNALVGLALIQARHAEIPMAQRYLRAAREAARAMDGSDHVLMARITAADGAIELERGRLSRAVAEARQAQMLDPRSSEAALVLARVALLRRQDATEDLRLAVRGRSPAPIAMGLLAPRVRGEEACQLASRYLERAPEGFDARAMQRIASRCNTGRRRLHP